MGFENEQESEVNHPSRRVETGSGRYGQDLLISVPTGKPLRKQNLHQRFWPTFLQELRRYAMRKPLRAELRVENLSQGSDCLPVARKNGIALIAIGENPIGTHLDSPRLRRFRGPVERRVDRPQDIMDRARVDLLVLHRDQGRARISRLVRMQHVFDRLVERTELLCQLLGQSSIIGRTLDLLVNL